MPRRTEAAASATTTQLSLFDVATPASAPAATTPAAEACDTAPLASEFRHPRADRELRLNGHLVAYSLRRARRRSIGFVVGSDGLSVNAPRWLGIGAIEAALGDKAGWILRKLVEQRERASRLEAARVDWSDGISLPYLGQTIVVELDPTARGALLDPDVTGAAASARRLRLGLPRNASPLQIRDAVKSWLQREARHLFEARCTHHAQRLGVRYSRLSLSSAQTRWGSASASGAIRLNWRLIHFSLATVDYVVVHELAHLREMNHSARFWDIVRTLLPDYELQISRLKNEVLPVFD